MSPITSPTLVRQQTRDIGTINEDTIDQREYTGRGGESWLTSKICCPRINQRNLTIPESTTRPSEQGQRIIRTSTPSYPPETRETLPVHIGQLSSNEQLSPYDPPPSYDQLPSLDPPPSYAQIINSNPQTAQACSPPINQQPMAEPLSEEEVSLFVQAVELVLERRRNHSTRLPSSPFLSLNPAFSSTIRALLDI